MSFSNRLLALHSAGRTLMNTPGRRLDTRRIALGVISTVVVTTALAGCAGEPVAIKTSTAKPAPTAQRTVEALDPTATCDDLQAIEDRGERTRIAMRTIYVAGYQPAPGLIPDFLDQCHGSSTVGDSWAAWVGVTVPVESAVPEDATGWPKEIFEPTWNLGNGYTASSRLRLWQVSRSASHPANISFTLPSSCKFQSGRDAVIPGEITITNTTSGWAIDPLTASLGTESGGSMALTQVVMESPRNDCGLTETATWVDPVEPQDSRTIAFFIVIRNYYTPEFPDGDPDTIASVKFGGSGIPYTRLQELLQ